MKLNQILWNFVLIEKKQVVEEELRLSEFFFKSISNNNLLNQPMKYKFMGCQPPLVLSFLFCLLFLHQMLLVWEEGSERMCYRAAIYWRRATVSGTMVRRPT